MIFYNATTRQGICQEIDRLCDSDDTSYPRLDKTARVNQNFEELIGEIISADGTWQWEDTNQTDLPIGKGTLVEGQQNYSFTSEYLDIVQLEILNKDGTRYFKIHPIDESELGGVSAEEYFGTDSSGNPIKGTPSHYDKIGDTIRLYPAPAAASVTLTNGLRVTFKRTGVLFTAVSTTATDSTEPGLPSPYHVILSYMSAIPYCMSYKKDRVSEYERKVGSTDPRSPYYGGMKLALMKFYGRREKDKRKKMSMSSIKFR